jgi:hypothetical protein
MVSMRADQVHLTIIVSECSERTGTFKARLESGPLLCRSRVPLCDAARVLLAKGHPHDTIVMMRHAGARHDALRASLRAAAALTVEDDKVGKPKFRTFRGGARFYVLSQRGPIIPINTAHH